MIGRPTTRESKRETSSSSGVVTQVRDHASTQLMVALWEAPFNLKDQSEIPSDIVSAGGTTTAQSEAATEKPTTSTDTDTKRSSG